MGRLLLVACAALLFACKREKREPIREILPVPIGTITVDSVAPGELAEGQLDAFGLRLPRAMRIEARFDDSVFANAALSLERVSNYVRQRVDAEFVETTPKKTVFRHAKLEGTKVRLHIEVIATSANNVQLVVRNETPTPAVQGLSVEQRWQRVGLTPNGQVLPESKE